MSEVEMDISVAFYALEKKRWESKVIKAATMGDTYQHTGIILHRNGVSVEYSTGYGVCRFVDSCALRKIQTPQEVIYLGKHLVNFERLQLFADRFHSEDKRSFIWWWFIGRFFIPKMLPPSCGLITCQLLRLCGIEIKDIVRPQLLFKELTNAANNYSWKRQSWKDYASKYHGT